MANDDNSRLGDFGKDIGSQFDLSLGKLSSEFKEIYDEANNLLNVFTQSRQRIYELRTSLTDAGPEIVKLGGSISDVSRIIGDVALSSRRNVIATTEEVSKLYAAEKILSIASSELTNNFLDVGIGIEKVSESLENSIEYIQSIGGNSKTIMKDVTENMGKMNRYQFEGGVMGLTKMAAQASMLRFNMNETFQLADKVLNPEDAVETAAAFQRLGVSAGNLVDPFSLMNSSINDPGALQDSLVDVAKQFTYFDEKTKTFKINPQGVLTLRQIQEQTGVSAEEMTKLGLAAAEADKRLSAINSAGLTVVREEDKQYLANIAKMEGGTYKVTLEDGTKKELTELTQPEFDKLIQQQKDAPKSLEEIAKTQMSATDIIKGDVGAIRAKIVGGIATARQTQEFMEGLRGGFTTLSGGISGSFKTESVRKEANTALSDVSELAKDIINKNVSINDAIDKYLEKYGLQLENLESKFKDGFINAAQNIRNNTSDKTSVERALKQGYDEIFKKAGIPNKSGISSLIEGKQNKINEFYKNGETNPIASQTSKFEFVGGIKIDVNAPPGFSDEKIAKIIYDKLNEPSFKDYIVNVTTPQNPTKTPLSRGYKV